MFSTCVWINLYYVLGKKVRDLVYLSEIVNEKENLVYTPDYIFLCLSIKRVYLLDLQIWLLLD